MTTTLRARINEQVALQRTREQYEWRQTVRAQFKRVFAYDMPDSAVYDDTRRLVEVSDVFLSPARDAFGAIYVATRCTNCTALPFARCTSAADVNERMAKPVECHECRMARLFGVGR